MIIYKVDNPKLSLFLGNILKTWFLWMGKKWSMMEGHGAVKTFSRSLGKLSEIRIKM